MSTPNSPWRSIHNVLIQNKCWLCNNTFPRGKTRKVFQISDLLTFYHNHQLRLQLPDDFVSEDTKMDSDGNEVESGINALNLNETAAKDEAPTTAIPKSTEYEFISENLQRCYDSYMLLMNEGDGKPDKLFAEFKEHGVEVWMSGLVCGMSPECKQELAYFIEKKHAGNGVGKKVNSMFALPSGTICPPGCGCDNPWPFMP